MEDRYSVAIVDIPIGKDKTWTIGIDNRRFNFFKFL